ncbi:proteinase-activated receptor 4 [Amia ocellicauda]|uniref:proteinase-activated receptor 4 n=1 Tax=Amia ocellicauda TaxID=2972642 RepID=UPI003463EDC7
MDSPSLQHVFFSCFLLFLSLHTFTYAQEDCNKTSKILRSFNLNQKCNRTVLDEKQKHHVQAQTTVLLIPSLYLVAFIIGLPANATALWVLIARTKKMPSTALLINLTSTDLLLMVVLPFRIAYHFQGNNWIFGEVTCRFVSALFYGNMYGSILCLMLISIDRYIALVHPFSAKAFRSRKNSICMSLAVWVVVIGAMLPLLLTRQAYTEDDLNITLCHDALPQVVQEKMFFPYFTSLFAIGFVIPLCVILFCYGSILWTLVSSDKRYIHAVKVTALVLVVFIFCFLPSNIMLLLHYSSLLENSEELYFPYMISLALSTFNSSLDPFIYYYVSDDFRAKLRKLFVCHRTKYEFTSGSSANTDSSSKCKSNGTGMTALNRSTDPS